MQIAAKATDQSEGCDKSKFDSTAYAVGGFEQAAQYFAEHTPVRSHTRPQSAHGLTSKLVDLRVLQSPTAQFYSPVHSTVTATTAPTTVMQVRNRSHTLTHAASAAVELDRSAHKTGYDLVFAPQRQKSFTIDGFPSLTRSSSVVGAVGVGISGSISMAVPPGSPNQQQLLGHAASAANSSPPPPTPSSASTSTSITSQSVLSHAVSNATNCESPSLRNRDTQSPSLQPQSISSSRLQPQPHSQSQSTHSQLLQSIPAHRSIKVTIPATVPGEPGRRVKMHECGICKKLFPRPSGLMTHLNSHSGARRECLVFINFLFSIFPL